MFIRVEKNRIPPDSVYVLRYKVMEAGAEVLKEVMVKGQTDMKKQAEFVASTRAVDVQVFCEDLDGEFLFAVASDAVDAAAAETPLIRELYQKSVDENLSLSSRLMLTLDEDVIRGMTQLMTSLELFTQGFKEASRSKDNKRIKYRFMQRTFLSSAEFHHLSFPSDPQVLALLSEALQKDPAFSVLPGLTGTGDKKELVFNNNYEFEAIVLQEGDTQRVAQLAPAFRGKPTDFEHYIILLLESHPMNYRMPGSLGILYDKVDEQRVVDWATNQLTTANPYKNRLVLVNRKVFTAIDLSAASLTWDDLVIHPTLEAELHLIERSVAKLDQLRAKGLRLKRGILISGPPGCGKTSSTQALIQAVYGKCTIILVEALDSIRQLYEFAKSVAPTIVILEDLDLVTSNRTDHVSTRDDSTGELLGVLSGTSEYGDIVTVATTNHPEKIDDALKKRSGRFDCHVRQAKPTDEEKLKILHIHLRLLQVPPALHKGVEQLFTRELLKLSLTGADIRSFVEMGAKRALLAEGEPSIFSFKDGVETVRSICGA